MAIVDQLDYLRAKFSQMMVHSEYHENYSL